MTKEEKIIATAFTGKMFIDGSDMGLLYEYMEKKVGHKVCDLILADKGFWEKLRKACEQDFIDMVSKEQPSLPSDIDEAAKEYAEPYHDKMAVVKAFKAGAEWMAEQGETYTTHVEDASNDEERFPAIFIPVDSFKPGKKVIVQIRKKY